MVNKITFKHETSGGYEHEHELPARFEVCSECEGYGTHLTPSIRDHAYSAEEFAESFDDEEERAAYFTRGGRYDVECECCHGRRVVAVVDEREAQRTTRGRRLLALYYAIGERESAYEAEVRAERRMGC